MIGETQLGKDGAAKIRKAVRKHNDNNPKQIVTNMSMIKLAVYDGVDNAIAELECFTPEFYRNIRRFLV